MNKSWLKYKVERHALFGCINKQWIAFKESMEEGDEIWFFTSEEYTWQTLCGREGYVVLRNGEPINYILTKMS